MLTETSLREAPGTATTKGWVPHLPMVTADGVEFLAPVKLVLSGVASVIRVNKAQMTVSFAPLMREGQMVYALPGGGEILDPALPPQEKRRA